MKNLSFDQAGVGTILWILLLLVSVRPVGSISLEEAYETALEKNQQIQESRQLTREARASVTEAKSRLYPHLEVSGYRVHQKELTQQQFDPVSMTFTERTFQPQDNYQYQVELRHNLYTGGKTWSGWNMRLLESRGEAFRHYRRKQEVLFQVARRYYGVLLSRRNLEIAQNTLKRSRSQLERARGRFDVGELTRTGVLRAEVSVSRAEQELRRAENDLTVSYEQLGLAIGMDTVPETVESATFQSMPDSDVDDFYRLAFRNRRDLKEARTQKRVSFERVEWERADYYPNINVISQYQDQEEPRFSDETEDWSVRLVGTYPIFSGWQQTADVREAQSRYNASRAHFRRLKKQVRVEIKNLYLDLKTQSKVIRTARSEVDSARQNFERITAEFEQGLVSSVDVNDALTALQEAESRLANARYNFQLGLIRLKLAAGTFQSDRLKSSY